MCRPSLTSPKLALREAVSDGDPCSLPALGTEPWVDRCRVARCCWLARTWLGEMVGVSQAEGMFRP